MFLRSEEDKPVKFTIVVTNKVKNVKLKIKPSMIPYGFLESEWSTPTELDKIIGSNGRTHGDKTVTKPAKNENTTRINIIFKVSHIDGYE